MWDKPVINKGEFAGHKQTITIISIFIRGGIHKTGAIYLDMYRISVKSDVLEFNICNPLWLKIKLKDYNWVLSLHQYCISLIVSLST